jgi:hypothetical protein
MALQKTIINNQGINVTYWHINVLQIRHKEKHVTINLAGYIDQAKRDAGYNPVTNYKYQIWPDTYDTVFGPTILDSEGNPLHVAYDWLKANTEFSDAVDI